jgi:hypothetical protein
MDEKMSSSSAGKASHPNQRDFSGALYRHLSRAKLSIVHDGEAIMAETGKRLFVGIKISTSLQNELNSPAPGTERYFKSDDGEFLQVVSLGDDKLIGRYVKDGFPVADIGDVSRNVRSIVRLITRGHAIGEDSVHIYAI